MKALIEKVEYPEDSSWRLLIRELESIPFEWHLHPEFELTLTLNSQGERYIADNISEYQDYDLTLLGPNIPHTWQSHLRIDEQEPHKVYVLWFNQAWVDQLTQLFPEYRPLGTLAKLARRGVVFPKVLAQALLPLFILLDVATPARRLTLFLQILEHLNECDNYQQISVVADIVNADSDRREQRNLSQLLEIIHIDYTQPISLVQLSGELGMSESTLTRFFKRMMGQGINRYITNVRLAKACSLLIRTDMPISLVAQQSGFSNQANFNRLFKKYKQIPPKTFRSKFKA